MSIPGSANPLLLASAAAAGGYEIQRSVRLNSADSANFSRTPASSGNRKTWTWAGWVKRSKFDGTRRTLFRVNSSPETHISFAESAQGNAEALFVYGASSGPSLLTTAVFRDPSAWYHIVVAFDTAQATASNRVKIYVNGTQVTAFNSSTYPNINYEGGINSTGLHAIGASATPSEYHDGYLADVIFVDGQALTPSSFGEFDTNNVWQPKAYTGTYGTNGFRLPFSDNSNNTATTLGKDTSGNGNNWTPNNLSVTAGAGNDSLVDSPSSPAGQTDSGAGGTVVGNYCTWNPLDIASGPTLSNGNLGFSYTSSLPRGCRATLAIPASGKWYFETAMGGSSQNSIGVVDAKMNIAANPSTYCVLYDQSGSKNVNGSASSYGASFASGDVIGIAVNSDTGQVTFYKNNASQGAISLTAGVEYFPFMGGYNSTTSTNFGQRPFAYTAPSGFKALCTANLPTPTIANGATAMDVKLYTGNGSTQTISGLGFSPDLVWIKGRSGATDHALYDAVRGVQKDLASNTTAAETTESTGLTAFNSDGFSIGALAKLNTSSATYAGWAWDAGTSTVTNTQGSITSQVRANASAGFSVVTYTGTGSAATVGHGLGASPSLIILKRRSTTGEWYVWLKGFTVDEWLTLNTNSAKANYSGVWNTLPTSTTFGIGDQLFTNGSFVAYCFAPVAGYSSFGSYTGNGSADGPFVYTGFRPRYVLQKKTSDVSAWAIRDAARDPYNAATTRLWANFSSAESSADAIDLLSNGFKVRNTDTDWNANGATYIYAAFAESPFALARAR